MPGAAYTGYIQQSKSALRACHRDKRRCQHTALDLKSSKKGQLGDCFTARRACFLQEETYVDGCKVGAALVPEIFRAMWHSGAGVRKRSKPGELQVPG